MNHFPWNRRPSNLLKITPWTLFNTTRRETYVKGPAGECWVDDPLPLTSVIALNTALSSCEERRGP
jgi:hypothetical protein